ncbi:phage portal protein [Pseudonocardia sp. T1-2H]|uniref:phage portal protein n=1 Tax=Pseudonocardia sp. T1-2H TaxID=3128899 RepID=UPI003101486C
MSRLTNWALAALIERTEITEAKVTTAMPGPPAQVARRGYEVGIPTQGLTENNALADSSGGDDRASLMTDCYDAYLACPWSWAAVGAISKTITGGGLKFGWSNTDGAGDQEAPDKPIQVLQCERLLKWCNPREDMIQLLRSVIADLLVFGDSFIEIVWAAGIPIGLYSLDCPSTTPLADTHGNITGYVQQTPNGQKARFEPHEVIHISLDAPRSGIFGVAPTFAALLPMKVWLFTMATLQEIFRKGNPVNLHVDHPASISPTDQAKWIDQYMTRNVGPKNIGRPVVTKGGGQVTELQSSRVDELLHTLDQQRDVIISAYGVPPAEVGIIESGNLGGGTGESQRKSFLVNTCQPIASLVLEKLNFVLLSAFGIEGWELRFDEVDMRDSEKVEKIRDMRIRSGLWTLNKARADIGEPAVDGGDQAIIVDRSGIVAWRDMDVYNKANIAKVLQGTALEPDDPGDEKTPLKILKPEPQPVPAALAGFAGADPAGPVPPGAAQDDTAATGKLPAKGKTPPPGKAAKETGRPRRPVRESWPTYRQRVREAMNELPTGHDRAA